jgi:beta-galactosidase
LPIQTDLVSPKSNLSRYKLVVAPLLALVDGTTAENLHDYVEQGGFLVLTFFSGIVDETGTVFEEPLPGPLNDVMGIKVRESDPIPESHNNEIGIKGISLSRGTYEIEKWCDLIELQTAKAIATYSCDFYKGTPSVTLNSFGRGKALYIGTMGKDGLDEDLIHWAAAEAGISYDFTPKDGVEIRQRVGRDSRYYFVLNHNARAEKISLPREMTDLISGRSISGNETLAPYGVLVLKSEDSQ